MLLYNSVSLTTIRASSCRRFQYSEPCQANRTMQGADMFGDWGTVHLGCSMEFDKRVRKETKILQNQVIVNHEYQTKGF